MNKGFETKDQAQRFLTIDVLRGVAVLLMVIFHVAFDLNTFGFASIDFIGNAFWFSFPRFIVTLFLVCVGMSLALAHKGGIRWVAVRRRFYKIGAWALVITILTYILFPENFVYFGILHCIAITSVVGVFFVGRPKLSLCLCVILLVTNFVFQPTLIPISSWLNVSPMDYIPFYPWFGVVLLGIYLESVNFQRIPIKKSSLTRPFEFMGKHSLKIYLLHRPIIYGLLLALYKLKG